MSSSRTTAGAAGPKRTSDRNPDADSRAKQFPLSLKLLGAAIGLLLLLNYAFDLAQGDAWWDWPRTQGSVVVAIYWTAVLAALVAGLAGLRLVTTASGAARLVGAAGLLAGAWCLAQLSSEEPRIRLSGFWAVASGVVRPATITYDPASQRIQLNGPLARGTAVALRDVLAAAPNAHTLELTSLGGLVDEARWVGIQIERRGMDTLVSDECASACVDIFASGRRRLMYPDALLGLHSASSLPSDTAGVEAANREFVERLYKIGVEPRFLMYGTETPAEDIWISTARQAYLAGLATEVVDPKQVARSAP
jgi:hypothetical protein